MEPVNLVGGALVAQVSLFFILFVGGAVIRRSERDAALRRLPTYGNVAWLSLALAVGSIGALILTDAFESVLSPAFNGKLPSLLPWSAALSLALIADVVVISILIFTTGGQESPFQSFVFIVPTLGIFLDQSTRNVIFYAVLAAGVYLVASTVKSKYSQDRERLRFARSVVVVLGLAVTVAVGLMTR